MRPMRLRKTPLSIGEKAVLVLTASAAALVGGLTRWVLDLDDRLGYWLTSLFYVVLVGLAVIAVGIMLLRER
ncbi:hypothetical protein DKT69_35615 [Micromonospora sicca]|jgi:hypothetical protein|uniref:Uncharacterized protein n=2 Tax=Micromonosporaceae TaxID=28056 RepID=A0A317D2Y3_9ACTN|nr:hypothetical protein DKT69_35615 [Micromonospora sp. 4G51]